MRGKTNQTRDHDRLGTQNREANCQCHRLARHASLGRRASILHDWRPGPLPPANWLATQHLLQRPKTPLAVAEHSRRAGKNGFRRFAFRQCRYLPPLEPYRRSEGRRARHGRNECQPYPAPKPKKHWIETKSCLRHLRFFDPCFRKCARAARCTAKPRSRRRRAFPSPEFSATNRPALVGQACSQPG